MFIVFLFFNASSYLSLYCNLCIYIENINLDKSLKVIYPFNRHTLRLWNPEIVIMVRYLIGKCRYCERESVVKLSYAKLNLCIEHFKEFIVSRVASTIKRYRMVKPGDRILLAVSGGKDSVALLHIMNSLSNLMKFKLIVLHIDLGIGEYSKRSREIVEDLCRKLKVDSITIDLKNDLGFTLPEFVSRLRTHRICSLCGIVKRYIMNAVSIALKADAVATAHHADDMLTYIFKNFILQDYELMEKLVPINKGVQGLMTTKIRPLYEVYEKDTALYTIYTNLRFTDITCPYKEMNSMEITIRRFLDEIEDKYPGTKISILRKFAKTYMRPLEEARGLKSCSECGLIAQKDMCTFCRLTKKSFGKPLGMMVKEKLSIYIAH